MKEHESYGRAFRQRLQAIVDRTSQRETAKSLGIPAPYVSRYLKNQTPPVTLALRLVEHLDVNPNWLLSGEGEPFLTDLTMETSAMASDMLQLVEAMSAVTKMRLGALAGKGHMKTMRELNDALVTYSGLRKKMSEHATPVFKKLNDDIWSALSKGKMEEAEGLIKAGDQVAELTDDPDLERDFVANKAVYYYSLGDFSRSVTLQRSALAHYIRSGNSPSREAFHSVINLVLALCKELRFREAHGLASAFLGLIHNNETQDEYAHFLTVLDGYVRTQLGELDEGLRQMTSSIDAVPSAENLQFCRRLLCEVLYFVGGVSLDGIMRDESMNLGVKALPLATIALWEEGVESSQMASKKLSQLGRVSTPETNLYMHALKTLLSLEPELTNKQRDNILGRFSVEATHTVKDEPRSPLLQAISLITGALVRERAGDVKGSLELVKKVESTTTDLSKGKSLPILLLALHHRTALRLTSIRDTSAIRRELHLNANVFFEGLRAKGYRALAVSSVEKGRR